MLEGCEVPLYLCPELLAGGVHDVGPGRLPDHRGPLHQHVGVDGVTHVLLQHITLGLGRPCTGQQLPHLRRVVAVVEVAVVVGEELVDGVPPPPEQRHVALHLGVDLVILVVPGGGVGGGGGLVPGHQGEAEQQQEQGRHGGDCRSAGGGTGNLAPGNS